MLVSNYIQHAESGLHTFAQLAHHYTIETEEDSIDVSCTTIPLITSEIGVYYSVENICVRFSLTPQHVISLQKLNHHSGVANIPTAAEI